MLFLSFFFIFPYAQHIKGYFYFTPTYCWVHNSVYSSQHFPSENGKPMGMFPNDDFYCVERDEFALRKEWKNKGWRRIYTQAFSETLRYDGAANLYSDFVQVCCRYEINRYQPIQPFECKMKLIFSISWIFIFCVCLKKSPNTFNLLTNTMKQQHTNTNANTMAGLVTNNKIQKWKKNTTMKFFFSTIINHYLATPLLILVQSTLGLILIFIIAASYTVFFKRFSSSVLFLIPRSKIQVLFVSLNIGCW